MEVLNEYKLSKLLTNKNNKVGWLKKPAFSYLLRYNGNKIIKYKQLRPEEIVEGQARPGELVVVQVNGEYHRVSDGKYDIDTPFTTIKEVESITLKHGTLYTSKDFINKAINELIQSGAKYNDIEIIGWAESTTKVKAFKLPLGFSEFEIDKTERWGNNQEVNANHLLVINKEGKVYANLINNIIQDWYAMDSGLKGLDLIDNLPELSIQYLYSCV